MNSVSEVKQQLSDVSGREILNKNIHIQRDSWNNEINNKTKSKNQNRSVTEILKIDKLMEKYINGLIEMRTHSTTDRSGLLYLV